MPTQVIDAHAAAALQSCPAEFRESLSARMSGEELPFEQALKLAFAEGPALEALVAVADRLRRETVGDAVTYVVNRNINFTNVCFVGCSFCGFGRGPGAADAYSLSFEEVVRRAREAWDRGATEVCIQGGLPRDLDGFFYRDLLRAIKHALPEMHVHAFSPMEIDYGVRKTGLPLRDYLRMMKDEGLGSIPGTAAEILDDRIRKELSPNKLPVTRWVEIITAAHELGIPTTSTMMYGHVEEPADWVRHILLLRAIQKRTGGFTEFVPLGFIHEKTRLYRHGGARPGAKREEHLRVHALARVLLHGAIRNVQVSWVKLGFEPRSPACRPAPTISAARSWKKTFPKRPARPLANTSPRKNCAPGFARSDGSPRSAPPPTRFGASSINRKRIHVPFRILCRLARTERHAPYPEGAY